MLKHKYIIILALLLVASALSAWSISDTYFGNRYGTIDGRTFAMGSASMFNNMRPGAFTDNPANLTLTKDKAGIQALSYINRGEDVRMLPLYNSFDNYVDDAVYASNLNVFTNFAGAGFLATRYKNMGFGIGAYHKPMLSFDGKYREEIRNNRNTDNDGYPEKIAQNDINNEGNLYKTGMVYSMAYALNDYMDFNLGFDYGMVKADVTQETTIKWSQWAIDEVGANVILPNYIKKAEWELTGNQMKIGTSLRIGPRFGFGLTITPKATLDLVGDSYSKRDAYLNTAMDSTFVVMDGDYILPSEYRFGLSYFPRNVTRTIFNMDMEIVRYSDVQDFLDDTYNFYAGVEHHIENRIPLRLGFQAVNSYLYSTENGTDSVTGAPIVLYSAKKLITPMITGGSSVQLMKNLVLDLGFGYSWREYEALDMFGDAYYNDKTYTGLSSYTLWPNQYINLQNRGWENPDKVKESFITLNAGISLSW